MKMIIDLKNKMELIVAFYLIYLIALLSYACSLNTCMQSHALHHILVVVVRGTERMQNIILGLGIAPLIYKARVRDIGRIKAISIIIIKF
jgi:hypothetical protein